MKGLGNHPLIGHHLAMGHTRQFKQRNLLGQQFGVVGVLNETRRGGLRGLVFIVVRLWYVFELRDVRIITKLPAPLN